MESYGSSINNTETKLLDMSRIPEAVPLTRIAYVHDVKLGRTKYDSGFITFILKDCNARVVPARLFDVANEDMTGVSVAGFKHKPVELRCVAQEFNGAISLIVDGIGGIKVIDAPVGLNQFIGQVESDLTDYVGALSTATKDVGPEWMSSAWQRVPLESIADGKLGGYAKVVEIAFGALKPQITDELLQAFAVTAYYYFEYLKTKQAVDVLGSLSAYQILNTVTQRFTDSESKFVYLDCLRSTIGMNKPLHLYAHLISGAFQFAETSLLLSQRFETQASGTKAFVGGVELSKY